MTIAYEAPSIPLLFTVSSYIYLLNVAESLLSSTINAGLIGSLALGIIFGPEASNILPEDIQKTFVIIGYIGLLLIVFEAGLSTDIALLYTNILLSSIIALSGVIFPIAFSIFLLSYGYGYTLMQAFAAGAALCSTSLGTTLALLRPEVRQTRTGAIILSAALLDDITGLVFAAIIPNLPSEVSNSSGIITWYIVARPVLVSLGFGFGTPLAAVLAHKFLLLATPSFRRKYIYTGYTQLFFIASTLSGFVAGAKYAGTSELFGAYLAGAFLAHLFPTPMGTSTIGLQAVIAQRHPR
ncbi:Sodium/hydrogen exchanger family-domain-containing protein [Lyophyllum atratum]|nr:Sodium/hydrogen exchanger family-domain-containing protein [Lyophyllum atratum]